MPDRPEPTARADLFHRLVVDAGLSPHWANRQIDAYAHQLAELQRLRMEELDLTGQKARIVGRIVDLIDPESEAQR